MRKLSLIFYTVNSFLENSGSLMDCTKTEKEKTYLAKYVSFNGVKTFSQKLEIFQYKYLYKYQKKWNINF